MKKIFSFCAALLAAMSMNATVTNMTCAEAAAAAALLQDKSTGTDSVCVTGYVTSTDGKISPKNGVNQQTFWMDDEKGTTQTFEGYWCNMPSNEEPALNVGDKVSISGFLKRYGTTMEMQNGDIVILERAVVNIDTIDDMSLCDVVAEALSLTTGSYSTDFFQLSAVVTNASDARAEYSDQTFEFTCPDDSRVLKVYNSSLNGHDAVVVGDTVEVLGKLMNYNGVAEMTAGKILNVKKGGTVIDTLDVTVAQALAVAQALENGATAKDFYRITGYVDSISSAYSAQYKNISFFLCDDLAAPEYEFQCYRVAGGEDIEVGDLVIVTGKINHYYKAATEEKPEVHGYQTPAGATYEKLPTAIETIGAEVETIKIIRNGEVIILRGGEAFTILGQQK